MHSDAQPYPATIGVLDPQEAKEALRTAVLAARRARGDRQRARASAELTEVVAASPQVRNARTVAAYVSQGSEPDTAELLEILRRRGTRVLLPVLGSGLQRGWAEYVGREDLSTRAPGRPPEPSGADLGPDALADADLVLAPALAVDTSGSRLGHGGGWYDRALLHARPGVPVVALVFDEEVYDVRVRPLPSEPHDRPVTSAATASGWRSLDA